MTKRSPKRRMSAEQVWRRWSRRQLIRRDGMDCALCKEPMKLDEVTIDHIKPVSLGGSDKLENLRLVHEKCNRERGAGFFKQPKSPRAWDELPEGKKS